MTWEVKPLYLFIASFIVGVAFFSFFQSGLYDASLYLLLSTAIWIFYVKRRSRLMFVIALTLFAFALGGLRFALLDLKGGDTVLDEYIGKEVVLEGVITEEPSERERSVRITINIDTIYGEALSEHTRLITSVSRFPETKYGDRIELIGVLERPENFQNEIGRTFNYVSYLAKDNIYYTLSFPEAELISDGHGHLVKRYLFMMKRTWLNRVGILIPDPHVSLLGGLVVGAQESLGEELEEDFRRTGIIHIVVLSGYNVTIVAEAIMRFFAFLPRLASLSLGAVTIVLFAIMTGASATIVRASIMALLVLLARATRRTSEITRALFLAGFFMVLHNPMIVLFDPSFQLSFLATLGLIYLAPALEKYFRLVPTKWKLREFATATIATQLFVLPLLLYMMGELSLVALPVNLLILGFVPLTMLFGFLTGIAGFISSVIAFPFAAVSYIFLAYELLIVDIFASLPFASIAVQYFPLWLMFAFYILYGFLLHQIYKKNTPSLL